MGPQASSPDTSLTHKAYTRGEEIANSLIHAIGTALSIAGLVVLVVLAARHGDAWRVVSFSIYGSTLVILYLASTLYHGVQHPRAKGILQIIDHTSIYLLIAGTYTPFLLVSLRGAWGWTLLGVIWGLALLGIGFQSIFVRRQGKLSILTYILMGWLCLIALREMLINVPTGGLIWLAVGGVLYTTGVLFYVWHRLPYNHAIWHLFVLAGSIAHFLSVLLYVLPTAAV
ncbi:hemolysin III family protein [Candidatus Neomarinimicrobiota bacterium]